MKLQTYFYTAGFLLGLPLSAKAEKQIESEGSAQKSQTASQVTPEETKEEKTGYVVKDEENNKRALQERVARLQREVKERENKLHQLRKELGQAEDAAEESEEQSKGNANHARDLIDAEAELVTKSLEHLISKVEELQDTHTEHAYQQLEKQSSFSFDDKMAVVNDFRAIIYAKLEALTDTLAKQNEPSQEE